MTTTMANPALNEDTRKRLEQIASLCPLHSLNGNTSENHSQAHPCRFVDFDLTADEHGDGSYFSCRRSEEGTCAGYIVASEDSNQLMEEEKQLATAEAA